jgi:hypothetical protein
MSGTKHNSKFCTLTKFPQNASPYFNALLLFSPWVMISKNYSRNFRRITAIVSPSKIREDIIKKIKEMG